MRTRPSGSRSALSTFAAGTLALAAATWNVAAAQAVPFPRIVAPTTEAHAICAASPAAAISGGTREGGSRVGATPVGRTPGGGAPVGAARDSAAALAGSAAVTALAGEQERARDLLREASRLDPTSAEIAFRLARVAEDLSDAELATAAYCRLRTLAADSASREHATARVEALAVDRGLLPPEPALGRFQRGLVDAANGALPGAERALDEALARAPSFAIAYYDRALVRLARGRTGPAAADLRRFAALSPRAAGREVTDALSVLERGERSPAAALGWGVIPGGAQLYSGRPWLGAVVAAAAATGVVLALQRESRLEERTFQDPFGRPYTDRVPVTVHPRRTLGLAVAGGATLAGALGGAVTVSADRSAVSRLVARVRAALAQHSADQGEAGRLP